ncbi:Uncharacterised protein [Mycobacteroides abscessus subsp. abscessus]|nr:Uncharacterised protein [Mycobacteroides abscessus subsp. abscessus]
MLVEQGAQGVPVQQRHVGRGDQQVTGEVGGQRPQRALHGVAGAELLFLQGGDDLAAQFPGDRGDRGADLFPVVADHRDQMGRVDLVRGMQRVGEHAPTGKRMQHFGGLRPHSRPGSGGENDDGGLLWHGSPSAACHRACVCLVSDVRGQR